MTIESYLADLENVQDLYNLNWRNPLGSIYSEAHASFRSTLDDQDKLNERSAEMMMLFVSIGMGGAMTGLLGSAILRSVALRRSLQLVGRTNVNRVLSAYRVASASPVLSFMAGSAYDGVSGMLKESTKSTVAALIGSNPTAAGIRTPTAFQNDLDDFVLRSKTCAFAIGSDIRDSNLSTAAKTSRAAELRAAPFFRNVPTRATIPDRGRAAKEIELLLYTILIMDSDFLVERTLGNQGDRDIDRKRTIRSVSEATSAPGYPTESGRTENGGGYSYNYHTSVEYRRPGQTLLFGSSIMSKVNRLHRDLYGSDFEVGAYGRDEVRRAETLSSTIQSRYLGH